MKKKSAHVLIVLILILGACGPKVGMHLMKKYEPLHYDEIVQVYTLQESAPFNAEPLGTIKIGDSGFTTRCSLSDVVELARLEARKVGGNALKIIEHTEPNLGSSCHRITAEILRVSPSDVIAEDDIYSVPEEKSTASYATLHVYRPKNYLGSAIGYQLHLGDSVVCKVKNNFKYTVQLTREELLEIWAKTESKESVMLNVKFGEEYYLRCGLGMGVMVGRPALDLIPGEQGKTEFAMVKGK